MRYLRASIRDECAYLIPIGDVHLGDKSFGKRGRDKLHGYIKWVKEHPNARIFIMGDLFNVASRVSKTSPFESRSAEYQEATGIFEPVKKQIIGAIDGNHEARMLQMFGYSPMQSFCAQLEIPYCGWSAVIEMNVGGTDYKTPNQKSTGHWNQYHVYAHHTTGGGGTLGGALNRSVKLQDIVQGIDVYLGAHNHNLATGQRTVFLPYPAGGRCIEKKVTYVDCGSYLEWDESYAEQGMYAPGKLGSPRIRFAGFKHIGDSARSAQDNPSRDIHVSI